MRKASLSLAAAVLATGCAPSTFTDRPATLHFDKPDRKLIDPDEPRSEEAVVRRYRALKGLDERRSYRDSIVWRQLAADDDDFNTFVRRVRSDRALMNMSSDGAVIFLNGLAAVTGTAGEKAALSTLSAGLLSSRGSVDRELFNLETMSAVLARMKAARVQALVPIRLGLRKSDTDYPLEQALVDLRVYADAGSLLSTLATITNDAGQATQQAEKEIAPQIRDEAFVNSMDARETLMARVEALKGNQLTALAFAVERYRSTLAPEVQEELARTDPSDARFRDATRARAYLITWLLDDPGAGGPEWQEAVTLAEKAKP